MNTLGRIVIVCLVIVAAAAVLFAKNGCTQPKESVVATGHETAVETTDERALPRLLELGSDSCIPCKKMMPILAELREKLDGQLQVDFIDVLKDRAAGKTYGVSAIPVQIFFDEEGTEIHRHIGFYPREDLLAKWGELGYDFNLPPAQDVEDE